MAGIFGSGMANLGMQGLAGAYNAPSHSHSFHHSEALQYYAVSRQEAEERYASFARQYGPDNVEVEQLASDRLDIHQYIVRAYPHGRQNKPLSALPAAQPVPSPALVSTPKHMNKKLLLTGAPA